MKTQRKRQSETKADKAFHNFLNTIPEPDESLTLSKGVKLYKNLREQKRDGYFVGCIKLCAKKGYDKQKTCQVLREYFGENLLPTDFGVDYFDELIMFIPKIQDAWGSRVFGDELEDVIIKDKAFSLALRGNMQDVESFVKLYGSSLKRSDDSESEPTEGTKPQEITFKLSAT